MLDSEHMDRARIAAQPAPRRMPWLLRWPLRLIGFLVQLAIALYGLGMIAYLVADALVGEDVSLVGFIGNFFPWLAWGGFILALVALFSRARKLLIALQLPGIILFVILYGELFWPQSIPATSGPPLTIATFNIHAHSDLDAAAEALATLDADLLGIEELSSTHVLAIEERLAQRYPYQALYAKEPYDGSRPPPLSGVGLLSRYPILEHEAILTDYRMRHMRATVNVDGVTVSVYVIHPDNPTFMPPHRYDTTRRTSTFDAVLPRLAAETNPVLVLCDCNMTDRSEDYRQMARLLNDSFREAGWGMGFTFSADTGLIPPAIRIDYVWHSDEFIARDAYVGEDNGPSDHYPVVAELALREIIPSEHAAR
jgi:vancomycin resistance protein VanJ